MADRNGYIGRAPSDSAVVVARQTFSPTGVTTDFTFASGYSIGYVDAYLNGSRLIEGQDYTATDGSVVSLVSSATSGDVLELVAYKAFNVATIDTAPGDLTVGGKLTVVGVTNASSANYTGNITAVNGTFTGNVSVAGTLTYEDVTNVDSIGIITARSGVKVQTGSATTALVVEGDARVTGILTIGTSSITLDGSSNQVNVGTGITLHHTNGVQVGSNTLHSTGFTVNNINTTGVITATSFIDDGTNLLTEINTKASTGKAIAMAMVFG
jgi:hypothetical protein